MVILKPIKLYFAGMWGGKVEEEVKLGVRNKLFSYLNHTQPKIWFKASKGVEGNVIIDSGAFSAWSRGVKIDIGEYIEYCQEIIHLGKQEGKEVRVVNLDIIPGQQGQTITLHKVRNSTNLSLIEEAAKGGYMNLKKMVKAGLKPIHVFHYGEDWKWLHRMTELTDYIGLSPTKYPGVPARKQWMVSVFEYMSKHNIDVDTHGFAVFMPSVLKVLPFTSCDATTWQLTAGLGKIYFPVGGFSNPDYSKNPLVIHVSERLSIKGLNALTNEKLKMLEKDGYSYEDLQSHETRCRVNIRYFLELEKWLNKYRANKSFRTRTVLL